MSRFTHGALSVTGASLGKLLPQLATTRRPIPLVCSAHHGWAGMRRFASILYASSRSHLGARADPAGEFF